MSESAAIVRFMLVEKFENLAKAGAHYWNAVKERN
jgi:hypothetical protein